MKFFAARVLPPSQARQMSVGKKTLHNMGFCAKVNPRKVMKAELPKNEDVVFRQQNEKVVNSRGNAENRQRRYVSAPWLIFWLLLPLLSLCLWLLRLLRVAELPF